LRRERAVEFLDQLREENRLDAILITELANVWYLTGFSGSEGAVVYSRKGRWFFSDFRYRDQARQEISGFKIVIFKNKFREIAKVLKKLGGRRIGFEASITQQLLAAYKKELAGSKFIPLKKSLAQVRAIKDRDEIASIKAAVRIAEKALEKALPGFKAGVSELEFAAELEFQLRQAGSGWFPFETIVASGPRAALPHGTATRKKIQKGELVVIDFGATFQGYASDLTVTVAAGEPGKNARRVYETVSQAQKQAIAGVAKGRRGQEIDALARGYIKRHGYGRYFGHGLGHGLGLMVHEEPVLNHKSETALLPGMVFTIEPGIYLPQRLGVRIEDDLLLNEQEKVLILSHSNRPLRVFE